MGGHLRSQVSARPTRGTARSRGERGRDTVKIEAITLSAGEVYIFGLDTPAYETIRSWGLTRWDKPKQALRGPAGAELLDNLAELLETHFPGRRLPAELEDLRWHIHRLRASINRERDNPNPVPMRPCPVKEGITMYKHQIRAYNMALMQLGMFYAAPRADGAHGRGYGLLFDMGCGKTLTAIAIMGAGWQLGKMRRALVVAPSSVVPVWPRELEDAAGFPYQVRALTGSRDARIRALSELEDGPGPGLRVAVINYESVWRDGIIEALRDYNADIIIADESQRIKSHDAAQSKAMHRLGDKAPYKLILSGTPVQNNAIDIYSQYRFLDPTIFGTNFYAFRNRYAIMGGFDRKQIVGYQNMDELIRRVYSIAYRVTKAEALDLPEQTYENRYVQLGNVDRKLYDQIRRDSYAELESGGEVTAPTVLTRLLRLQQITGGFLKLDNIATPKQVNHAKLDALMDIVNDAVYSGQKLVVFARFTPEIGLISKTLRSEGIRHAVLDGRTPMEHHTDRATGAEVLSRGELVEDFQNNPETMVFVAQIQTAGLGITLHAASLAVFYSLDFSYGNYAQALARIHRIGQRHPVTYIHLLVERSVDEKVLKALNSKQDLAQRVMDNWRMYFE